MRQTKNVFLNLAVPALVGVLITGEPSLAASFTYQNFNSTAGLIFQAHASPLDGKLRLSPAIPGLGLGGVWLDAKQPVKDGFDTTFQIQITDKYVYGADGMAFVIQNAPTPGLGWPGSNIGFGSLTNLLVVKFDDYHWQDHTFVAFDEIAVLVASSPTTTLWDEVTNTLASATKGVVFSDGRIHTVRIVYIPGNLQVFLDDLENPLMTVYVNLARVMDLDDGRAWVGFTAASGADWQNHDLVSWVFDSSPQAIPNEAQPTPSISPQIQIVNPMPSPAVYLGQNTQSSTATPLVVDPFFGYALPADTGLAPQIEASTDLVQWTPLTNVSFYFRDRESTNYPRRFYRFQKN